MEFPALSKKKPHNKSTKNATETTSTAAPDKVHSTVGNSARPKTTKKNGNSGQVKHKFAAFFVPPARLINGLKAQQFFEALHCHHSWFKQHPRAISIKTITNGRQIIIPNNQAAENALKCPVRFSINDTINLNIVSGHKQATRKFAISGLSWTLTPFDFSQDKRVTKCSVMNAKDGKSWTAILHSTETISSLVVQNKHYKTSEMMPTSKRCTNCQKHGHQKY